MTILLIDGFDLYNGTGVNTGLQARWTTTVGSGGSNAMITGRFGGQALRNTTGSGGASVFCSRTFSSAISSGSIGLAVRVNSLTPAQTIFMHLRDSAGTYMIGLGILSSGAITALRTTAIATSTVLGTSAASLVSASTWHYVELEFVISDTVGEMRVYLDGTQILNLTNVDTRNGSPTTVQNVVLSSANGSVPSLATDIDDLYITNSTTRLGERRVETIRPNADTSEKDFTPLSGTDNFAMVDDTTCDGDTTYVQASTAGDLDLYTTAGLSSTPTAISAVQITAFALKTDATTREIALSVKSGATSSDGSNYALAASYTKFDRILETDPDTAAAWDTTGVNSLEFGPKVTT